MTQLDLDQFALLLDADASQQALDELRASLNPMQQIMMTQIREQSASIGNTLMMFSDASNIGEIVSQAEVRRMFLLRLLLNDAENLTSDDPNPTDMDDKEIVTHYAWLVLCKNLGCSDAMPDPIDFIMTLASRRQDIDVDPIIALITTLARSLVMIDDVDDTAVVMSAYSQAIAMTCSALDED